MFEEPETVAKLADECYWVNTCKKQLHVMLQE